MGPCWGIIGAGDWCALTWVFNDLSCCCMANRLQGGKFGSREVSEEVISIIQARGDEK